MDEIRTGGLQFSIDGASVLIAVGATEQVGPYWITVSEVAPAAATFSIIPVG
jgi:hypothetical protein